MIVARSRRAGAAAVLLMLATLSEAAQAASPSSPPPPPAAVQDAAPAPYDPELFRLSQIVGALAYLSDICGRGDGDVWRTKMVKLLQAVGDSEARRQRMAGAYNKGYRDYELTYRTCTDNARTVIARYVAEGAKLSHDVASRFGGS